MKKIKNVNDLAKEIGVYDKKLNHDQINRLVEKCVYESTDCGAWINFRIGGVDVGSIVEGVDECTETIRLNYNHFTKEDFWNSLTEIERQTEEIWNNTHGCEYCGCDGAINPDCKHCHGEGVIL